ncbi:MAG: GNAT family N-acetyltransferase [Ardenticatenaceae bacterium]
MNFWQGKRIKLRGIEPADAEAFFAWNKDSDMARFVDHVWFPVSLEFVKRWAEKTAAEGPKDDQFQWVIEDLAGNLVGTINTHDCDRRVGTFEYGVAVREEHKRKGYAAEAILLVLRYFFEELHYQKVTAHVYSNNRPSIRLHETLHFQLEGRLRRMAFTEGQYFDKLVYGMTVEEFQAAYPREN